MIGAEAFREILIEIHHIDADAMISAGICKDTATRMMGDPIFAFRSMTKNERRQFWPLVEASLDRSRAHSEPADFSGENSRHSGSAP